MPDSNATVYIKAVDCSVKCQNDYASGQAKCLHAQLWLAPAVNGCSFMHYAWSGANSVLVVTVKPGETWGLTDNSTVADVYASYACGWSRQSRHGQNPDSCKRPP